MFCNKCGKSLADDSLFCNYCGAKVSLPTESEKPKERASASSCKEKIAEWSEEHSVFLKENSLELISLFKGDIAIAKSTKEFNHGEPKYYAIRGEETPAILSEAKQNRAFDHGIKVYEYKYYDETIAQDRECYFFMKDSGFVYSEECYVHIVSEEYVLTDSPLIIRDGSNNICKYYSSRYDMYSIADDKVVLNDVYTEKNFHDNLGDFEFIPNASKYKNYNDLGEMFRKRTGVIYSNGKKILYPDDNTSFNLDGFSKTQNCYIFKLTKFKEYKNSFNETSECYTLEYLDLSGKSLAKFDDVCHYATEKTSDTFMYDVITTVKRHYNEAEEEYENVYTHILIDHNSLKHVEAFTDVKNECCTLNLAEYNGVTCPYIASNNVTKLYNPKLELLTEVFGEIAYTFTANNKLYSVNEIRDRRMGLDFTAVYNVNDDEECFRAEQYKDFEIIAGSEGRFFVGGYQTDLESSPFVVKHKGKDKVLFVCCKPGGKHGLVDLEGNVVVPFEYNWINIAYNDQHSWVSYIPAVPKNHIYMGSDTQLLSLCDPDGNFIIKDLEKDDFDRKVEELFPECRKSE